MRKVCTKILSIVGNVLTVRAEGIAYEELAEVATQMGKSLAQVIRLDKDKVYLQAFQGSKGISTGDEVTFLGHPMRVGFSSNLLGRIFTGSGVPRDGGPSLGDNMIDKEFLSYIDDALKEYEEYKKMEGKGDFSFREFLSIVMIWKLEGILERIDEIQKG